MATEKGKQPEENINQAEEKQAENISQAEESKEEKKGLPPKKSPKAKKSDDWDIMVKIKLPKAPKTEQNFQFVAVNGRAFQVPRGKTVEVPKPIAVVLKYSEEAKEAAEEFENGLAE